VKPENKMIEELLGAAPDRLLDDWMAEAAIGSNSVSAATRTEGRELLEAFHEGIRGGGDADNFDDAMWERLRGRLETLSRARAAQGVSAADTSQFLLALKKPLFAGLQHSLSSDPGRLVAAVWAVSTTIDRVARYTMGIYQRSREELISRQQQELLELSTPVVKLWDGVLAVPMIGTLDSSRTQVVMETLLQRIVDTGSELAIIDITGVPTVDTLVAQHLLKTVTAIRLMGADCIISGIRPQIAQTIVHLGIDLQGISTKASLADALALALARTGYTISRREDR
jgi:rsbT co-antagonist protein RsbR